MLYPLLFESNLQPVVWGGSSLRVLKGLMPDGEPIGESWEVSALPRRSSIVADGPLQGKTLRALTAEYGAALLGQSVCDRFGTEFPLLVKLIDAESNLSVQVHPGDEQAMRCHGCMGKTEMWYVLDAKPGAFIYAGFSRTITPQEYLQRVADGTICEVLAKHDIHPGDTFYIPSGMVHSIGAGTMLVEVQQSSDITYRIFDYHRLGMDGKPRPLHTLLAKDALDYTACAAPSLTYPQKQNSRPTLLCTSPYFEVWHLVLDTALHRRMRHHDSFVIYLCLGGCCTLNDTTELSQGQSCLVPALCADDIHLAPMSMINGGQVEMLEIFIPRARR